ncbi:ABC transporter ATP-binding protein [Lactococcus fujiensis]|nr:ABC transporter ATP-binding protein [Lactococcus fujiensis]
MRLKTIDNYFSLIYPLFDSDRFWSLIEEYKIGDQQFQKFSKGEQCLIIVILALCTDCSYIILDEPLDGLDVIVRKQVVDLMIDTISDQERSIILASHNLHELEKLADQVAILNNKTISTILDLTTVKMSIHKIQVAFKDSNLPQFVREAAESIISEGRVTTIIFDNYSEALKQRIIAEEPIFIEDLPLSLEDILVSKFSKEKLKGDK